MESKNNYNKNYYEEHRDKIIQTSLDYYRQHAAEIILKEREKRANSMYVTCVCGSIIKAYGMSKHKKSVKHIEFVAAHPL